jgi:DNA-binding winged helix-turn-helix (wHTH) protein
MFFSLNALYRFDEFELNLVRRTLLRNGEEIALLPRTFDVLACLVENPGRVVAKEEILKAVWREAFVEENNLTQHISLLRKALADRARCIATIPGRGYQFTATVAADAQTVKGSSSATANGTAPGAAHARESSSELASRGTLRQPAPAAEPGPKPQVLAPSLHPHLLDRAAR